MRVRRVEAGERVLHEMGVVMRRRTSGQERDDRWELFDGCVPHRGRRLVGIGLECSGRR